MYKLSYHVPESHLEATKQAVFDAGAGRVGAYDCCCWQVRGEGQFRPLTGSEPYLGRVGSLEHVDEYRVEMVCADEHMEQVVAALMATHPYQTPAYDVIRLVDL